MRMIKLIATVGVALGLVACGPRDQQAPSVDDEDVMTELAPIRDLWNFNDPAASETAFRGLAAQAEAAGDNAYAAEAMTQVARTFSLRRDFASANAILDQVDAGAHAQVPLVRVRSLLERGRTLNSGGDQAAALPLFEEAFATAAAAGEHFLAGDAIHMAGIAADLEGEIRWMRELEAYLDDHPGSEAEYWVARMRNNLGWSYFFAGRYADALPEFQASRTAYAAEDGKRYETLIADYSTGRVLRALDRCVEALPLQEATYQAIRQEFETEDEYVAEEIALCRAALGDVEGALGPATVAFTKFSQDSWFVENEAERLEVLRGLSGQ